MSSRDIVVMGASAGGVEAIREIVGHLDPNLPGAVFIVVHSSPFGHGFLPEILARAGPLPAAHAIDGEPIGRSRIYVAPPDRHLTLEPERVRVSAGPRENRHRPAIDTLFRSAARCCNGRTVGVVLSGLLDDGSAGLAEIRLRGGIGIVQDPETALYPSMPRNALEAAVPDYCLSPLEIARLMNRLVGKSDVAAAAEPIPFAEPQGKPSIFVCPECGGALWEIHNGNSLQFRCRVGHLFSAESMAAAKSEDLDRALWAALRSLEESAALARRLETEARTKKQDAAARNYAQSAIGREKHAAVLRGVLDLGNGER